MPLVIITGYPTAGKSTRARQLHADLLGRTQTEAGAKYRLHVISDQSLSISRAVYDLSPDRLPAHTRSANASEKDARAAIYGAVKRVLSPRDIVILDGLNYIKGWRYQLYCEAKNLRTPSAVLQVGCAVETAKAVNEARLARECASAAATAATGAPQAPAGDDEGPYEAANWENLVFRYEEPNAMSRWDSPLFTLAWDDDEAQTKQVFASLWESIAGQGRKAVQPNGVAVQRGADVGGDVLYMLDRETQVVVREILDLQPDEGGGSIKLSRDGGARPAGVDADLLVLDLPDKKVMMPQLQRLRSSFLGMNRGGIGMDGAGGVAARRIRESFVGFLNDAFETS